MAKTKSGTFQAARLVICALVVAGCGRVGFDGRDGGSNALADGDSDAIVDAALTFCQRQAPPPTFCSDFDDGTLSAWSMSFTDIGATINVGADLRFATDTPSLASTDSTSDGLQEVFASASQVTVAFDLEVTLQGQSDPVISEIQFTATDGTLHFLEYVHRLPTPYLEEMVHPPGMGQVYYSTPLPSAAAGVHRIQFEMINGSTPAQRVSIDGVSVLDQPMMSGSAGTLKVELGVPFLQGASAPWQVRIDNVVINAL